MLEKGVISWRSPIMEVGNTGLAVNMQSGKPYRGVNVFLLAVTAWCQGYGSSHWLTFNQAKARGGSVKKDEKATRRFERLSLGTVDGLSMSLDFH